VTQATTNIRDILVLAFIQNGGYGSESENATDVPNSAQSRSCGHPVNARPNKMTLCRFVLLASALALGETLFAQEKLAIESNEFRISCASCHGVDGRGNGPIAKFLTPKPSDLTLLAKRNGGEYPFLKIFLMIDGREDVAAHGDRAMPVWGNRYSEEEAAKQYGPFGGKDVVMGRILELVYSIQLIQQK